jgi:hypothetical protein
LNAVGAVAGFRLDNDVNRRVGNGPVTSGKAAVGKVGDLVPQGVWGVNESAGRAEGDGRRRKTLGGGKGGEGEEKKQRNQIRNPKSEIRMGNGGKQDAPVQGAAQSEPKGDPS